MPPQEFTSYEDFFTFYLHEHSDARNRLEQRTDTPTRGYRVDLETSEVEARDSQQEIRTSPPTS